MKMADYTGYYTENPGLMSEADSVHIRHPFNNTIFKEKKVATDTA